MRQPARWALVGGVGSIALALAVFDPRVFTGGDNAAYYALAEALATGRGYVDLVAPGAPPHTQYPPGFPLVLVPFHWIFGGSYVALKLASMMAAGLALWGAWALALRDRAVPVWAVVAVVPLLGLYPVFLDYTHRVLSDMTYLAAALASLVAFAHAGQEGGDRWRGAWLIGVAAAAIAFYVRTPGLALIVAAVGWAALQGHVRRAGIALAGLVGAIGPWLAWTATKRPPETGSYLDQLVSANPYDPTGPTVSFGGMMATVSTNLVHYASVELPGLLWPSSATPPGVIRGVALLVAGGLLVYGLLRSVRLRGVAVHDLYALVTVAVLAVWPFISDRFFLTLAPVAWLYVLVGTDALSRRALGSARPAALAAGGVALVLLAGGLARVPGTWGVIRAHLDGDELAGYTSFWSDYFESARWIGRQDPTAVIVARKPRLTWMWSRQPAFVYPFRLDPRETWETLEEKGATHILLGGFDSTRLYLLPALEARPDRFELVHAGPARAVLVLRIVPETEPTLLPSRQPSPAPP